MKPSLGKKFLSDLKLYTDYFKWQEDLGRYENWDEACEDIIHGHHLKYKDKNIENELESALDSMKEMKVFASQRNLQFRSPQIEKSNARIYNCSVLHAVKNSIFQHAFWLLLNGCGVGVSLLKPFVNNISNIQPRSSTTQTFVIPDSIEGWADALGVLLSSYFIDNQPFPEYANCKIRFDYSLIRPEGTMISGGFKAPGPNGLKNALEKIESLLDTIVASGKNKLSPINVYDIICHSSDSVLAGGLRRSALIMLIDPNDEEMINAKIGNWRQDNPQRARSNNSVMLLRSLDNKDLFYKLAKTNDGESDIGFLFVNSWLDMGNPCLEILFTPIDTDDDVCSIKYDDLDNWIKNNIDKFGVQFCNLTSINAEKMSSKEVFLKSCKDAAILGTLQAGYTSFPYLGKSSENITKREALLGVSMTGWMNNPKVFNPELLEEGARLIVETNKNLSKRLGINQAARTTCVKPEGNLSVVAQTASGCHPEHAEKYFRIMQLNKLAPTAAWIFQHMPFLLEESVWSANNTDYVVFVPVVNPPGGLFKKDMKGVKHLEMVKLIQDHWIKPGTVKELGISKHIQHNVSVTVIIDNIQDIVDYIWNNKNSFTGVSFISDYGDKDFNQAPFTSILSAEEVFEKYGKGALFASGLIVDGLHYFNNNLWQACDCLLDANIPIVGTREQVLLKKDWIRRGKQFAKNYFKSDIKQTIYCLKDIHLFHKFETISRNIKEIDFSKILTKPTYKNVADFAAQACSAGQCEIARI